MTDEALYTFVAEHQNDDIAKLLFAYKSRDIGIDIREAVTQIECRRKTAAKLPHFNAHKQFYYPSLLAAEQSSNEAVAAYHASLVPCGTSVADLTAGLGIDAMTIAEKAAYTDMYEINPAINSGWPMRLYTCLVTASRCYQLQIVNMMSYSSTLRGAMPATIAHMLCKTAPQMLQHTFRSCCVTASG